MRQQFNFADFRGGINVDVAPDHLADNELEIADNVDLSERGGLKKRPGTEQVNATCQAGTATQLFEWPRNNGDVELIGVTGNQLQKINVGGSSDILYNVNSDKVAYFSLQDMLYTLDGSNFKQYDGSASGDVTAHAHEENDLEPIRRCKFAVRHPKSLRIFYAGDSQDRAAVYFSEPNQPNFVKATNRMYPTTGDGPVTALALFVDAVLVFFKNSIWVWRGLDPASDAIWHKLPTSEGTESPYTICLTTNSLTYLGRGGIYSLSPSIIGVSAEIQTGKEMVHNITDNRVASIIRRIQQPDKAVAEFDAKNSKYMLSYSLTGSTPDSMLVVDETLGAFVRWTIPANDISFRANNEVWLMSGDSIVKLTPGFYEDWIAGVYQPISVHIRTPRHALGAPLSNKLYTRVIASTANEDAGEYTLKAIVDNEVVLSETMPMISASDLVVKRRRLRVRGKRIALDVTNTDILPFTLYGLGLEAKLVRSYGGEL